MNQIALDFTPLARRTDPQTSIDAGRKVQQSIVALHERLIIDALRQEGPMTAKEMEPYTGLTSVEISRRSGGLMKGDNKRCQYKADNGTGDHRKGGFGIWELIG